MSDDEPPAQHAQPEPNDPRGSSPPQPLSPAERGYGVLRRMTGRSSQEEHRAASPLELFFDLCFVVAVAECSTQLVHALAEGHVVSGLAGYAAVFFGVWWAWMNFTWFSSAYDTDDVPFRVLTLVQMAGVQVYAAGVSRAFTENDWTVGILGYIVMRLALTIQWLRAAHGERDAAARQTARKYAAGLLLCQVAWVVMLFAPPEHQRWLFVLFALAELTVPLFAERRTPTSWHPHHIAERYGLFTIIVLGETISAGTTAVHSGITEHEALGELLPVAAGGLLLVFAAWWIYFAAPVHGVLRSNRQAMPWGYGHYLIFAAAAAIGAGIEVSVEHAVGKTDISTTAASAAVTVPAAVYLLTVWLLHARHQKRDRWEQAVLPVCTVLVLACTFTGTWAVLWAGAATALAVAAGVALAARQLPARHTAA